MGRAERADTPPHEGEDDGRIERAYVARSPLESLGNLFRGSAAPTTDSPWPPWLVDAMQDPAKAAILSGGCAAAATIVGLGVYRRFLRRIPNADSVTAAMIDEKRKIVGVVTR